MCRCNSAEQNVLGEYRDIPGSWHSLGCPMHGHYDEADYLGCPKCHKFADGDSYEPQELPYLHGIGGGACPICGRAPGAGPRGFMAGAPAAPRMGQDVTMSKPTAGALVGAATLGLMLLFTAG
jgi:hypothetical protein